MTNTYMLGGDRAPEEIVASIKKGLYATNFGGGQVDITSGKFVFSASEAFWVENGKILYPVKGATIVGNGPDALTRVTMIGNDMKLDSGVGTCGKEGQSVPVGVGQPTLAHRRPDRGRHGLRQPARARTIAMPPAFRACRSIRPRTCRASIRSASSANSCAARSRTRTAGSLSDSMSQLAVHIEAIIAGPAPERAAHDGGADAGGPAHGAARPPQPGGEPGPAVARALRIRRPTCRR